jgi:hypothetical protein
VAVVADAVHEAAWSLSQTRNIDVLTLILVNDAQVEYLEQFVIGPTKHPILHLPKIHNTLSIPRSLCIKYISRPLDLHELTIIEIRSYSSSPKVAYGSDRIFKSSEFGVGLHDWWG